MDNFFVLQPRNSYKRHLLWMVGWKLWELDSDFGSCRILFSGFGCMPGELLRVNLRIGMILRLRILKGLCQAAGRLWFKRIKGANQRVNLIIGLWIQKGSIQFAEELWFKRLNGESSGFIFSWGCEIGKVCRISPKGFWRIHQLRIGGAIVWLLWSAY